MNKNQNTTTSTATNVKTPEKIQHQLIKEKWIFVDIKVLQIIADAVKVCIFSKGQFHARRLRAQAECSAYYSVTFAEIPASPA